MTDYSQSGEQAAILDALKGITGPFLDIGAYHPTVFSNTRALYEMGWSGVMVEPSPGPMKALLEAYGNDERIRLIQAAVSLEPGLVPLHITDDAVSTSNESSYQIWKDAAKFSGVIHVPAITLEAITNQFGGFHFWNIDAEGLSGDLFHRMLALEYRPTCVCVEHDNRTTELLSSATKAGYKAVLVNGTNLLVAR